MRHTPCRRPPGRGPCPGGRWPRVRLPCWQTHPGRRSARPRPPQQQPRRRALMPRVLHRPPAAGGSLLSRQATPAMLTGTALQPPVGTHSRLFTTARVAPYIHPGPVQDASADRTAEGAKLREAGLSSSPSQGQCPPWTRQGSSRWWASGGSGARRALRRSWPLGRHRWLLSSSKTVRRACAAQQPHTVPSLVSRACCPHAALSCLAAL